eukprot:m.153412 g.153412  ORF g.153412 m.153412 type:complete len:1145 (+) comp16232_c1_seq1:118-3552(+)
MAELHDLAAEEELDEDGLTRILQERYEDNLIYTYVGDILIAVNPYQQLDLYTDEMSAKYCNVTSKADHPPHIFAIADAAYQEMMRLHQPQVAVISGESGAGKTESTKLFIRQVMDVSARGVLGGAGAPSFSSRSRHPLEEKIIRLNPILEAFGNAQTVMNDNSSRFGKFVELKFDDSGLVQGAALSHYLLEKARVVQQGPGERNFHIFELVISGSPPEMIKKYGLSPDDDYIYVQNRLPLRHQRDEMNEITAALKDVGFTVVEIDNLMKVLASILLFGNLEFAEDNGDGAIVATTSVMDAIATNLGVDSSQLQKGFMTAKVVIMRETIIKDLNPSKCHHAKDAVAKALYDRLFTWIITRLDLMLSSPDATNVLHAIGILDIFGFENFRQNGFDQLCINLANEQLHHFFNQHIFAAEMKAYAEEEVDGLSVLFSDNIHVLNLFFGSPGVFSILDEQTKFAQGSDAALTKLYKEQLAEQELFDVLRGDHSFQIKHYAGPIAYEIAGLLEKNKDPLPEQMASAMATSTNSLAQLLFLPDFVQRTRKLYRRQERRPSRGMSRQMSRGFSRAATIRQQSTKRQAHDLGFDDPDEGNKPGLLARLSRRFKKTQHEDTVSAQFKISLDALMFKMSLCSPHFIRCIKPNLEKRPQIYVPELVLKQMQYTGMLQTIRMRREGFAVRMTFEELITSYQGIAFKFSDRMKHDKSVAAALLEKCREKQEAIRAEKNLTHMTSELSGWLVAKSKVFLKYWHTDVLDSLLHPSKVAAVRIQCWVRRYLARKRFLPILRAYRDQLALAVSFINDLARHGQQVYNNMQTLLEEEEARGPVDLGLAKEVNKKQAEKEKKKLVKEANKNVDVKKLQKAQDKEKKAVVKWWQKYEERRRVHLDANGEVHTWFHGLLSRHEAESYLFDEPDGTFLIRVSETSNSYAVSVKKANRCRHYRVNLTHQGGYQVMGSDEDFGTLEELVDFYASTPLSNHNDKMLTPLFALHDLRLGFGNAQRQQKDNNRRPESTDIDTMTSSTTPSLKPADYLKDPHNLPSWLRGNLSRQEAERELRERGLEDGRFLVRLRNAGFDSVTYVVSYAHRRKFYHHLLVRDTNAPWTLNDRPLRVMFLEEVIEKFQGRVFPGLATRLESDAPDAVTLYRRR